MIFNESLPLFGIELNLLIENRFENLQSSLALADNSDCLSYHWASQSLEHLAFKAILRVIISSSPQYLRCALYMARESALLHADEVLRVSLAGQLGSRFHLVR